MGEPPNGGSGGQRGSDGGIQPTPTKWTTNSKRSGLRRRRCRHPRVPRMNEDRWRSAKTLAGWPKRSRYCSTMSCCSVTQVLLHHGSAPNRRHINCGPFSVVFERR